EPVEDHARIGRLAGEVVADDADDDVVRNELTRVHVAARLRTERRTAPHGVAQHVAGRQPQQPEPLREQRALRALSRAGWAEENQILFHQLWSTGALGHWSSCSSNGGR